MDIDAHDTLLLMVLPLYVIMWVMEQRSVKFVCTE